MESAIRQQKCKNEEPKHQLCSDTCVGDYSNRVNPVARLLYLICLPTSTDAWPQSDH